MPLIESAPNVVPWYAMCLAIALYFGCTRAAATSSSCRVSGSATVALIAVAPLAT